MLIITYTYKNFNEQGFRDTESIEKVNSKNYTKYLDKAKKIGRASCRERV